MHQNKKFSIIIPTYKRTELLNRAMNSVKDQDYENYEVIICSDGYSEEDKQCVLNMNDNRFIYNFIEKKEFKNWGHAQRNAMISKCTGDYTIWLDDDNTIEKDYLSFSNNELINDQYGMLVHKIKHNACGIIPTYQNITGGNIDTLNVMVKTDIAKKIEWRMSYDADFFAIKDIEKYCLENNFLIVYFDKLIGTHN
jgi:glycosyltransferase involved in cell wall biosynthesis